MLSRHLSWQVTRCLGRASLCTSSLQQQEVQQREQAVQREQLHYDVAIVGGGAICSCAHATVSLLYFLKKLTDELHIHIALHMSPVQVLRGWPPPLG